MKNPNGYGTVTKLSGNRRRPYVVKEGISGKQKPIGYTATLEEGLIMLAKYNDSPWDLKAQKITFKELYELWIEKKAYKLGRSNQFSLNSAYKHCLALEDVRYKLLKPYQMQGCIDGCKCGYSTQASIKNLFRHLDRFALEMDLITRCASELLQSDPIPETTRGVFTDEEVDALWQAIDEPWADSIIFFLYTGLRISEMIALRVENIDVHGGTIIGGTKTAAGKNRVIPIHSKILPIIKKRISNSKSGFLFEYKGKKLNQTQYRTIWAELMHKLGMKHTPHECRHTFRSRMDSAGANKVCIDRIMGHKSKGTGERVYTHKTVEELKVNIELITN